MSPWLRVVIATVCAACAGRTPSVRERALEHISAQARVIAAADGAALASPTFRRVVDALRPHVPITLECVVEAALTSEAIAVGVHPDVGTTIVLVTRAAVARCPALSKVADTVYVATIGAAELAADREHSILGGALADAGWERARPYLLREPFALAVELPTHRAIAVAQPDPLDAWVAIDATDTDAIERAVTATLARYQIAPATDLANKLEVKRTGTQVTVHADRLVADELATIAGDLIRAAEKAPRAPVAVFTCPPPGLGIVSCHDGTSYKVTDVAELLRELGRVDAVPVVAGGDIVGIRLIGDPPRLLRRDDVVLGLESHRIIAARQLADLAGTYADAAALAVRRDGVEVVLQLSE